MSAEISSSPESDYPRTFTCLSGYEYRVVYAPNPQVVEINELKQQRKREIMTQGDWTEDEISQALSSDMFFPESIALCSATVENLLGAFILEQIQFRGRLLAQFYPDQKQSPVELRYQHYISLIPEARLQIKVVPGERYPYQLEQPATVLVKQFPGAHSGIVLSGSYTGCMVKADFDTKHYSLSRLLDNSPLHGTTQNKDRMPYTFGRKTTTPEGNVALDERDKDAVAAYLEAYVELVEFEQLKTTLDAVFFLARHHGVELNASQVARTTLFPTQSHNY